MTNTNSFSLQIGYNKCYHLISNTLVERRIIMIELYYIVYTHEQDDMNIQALVE